MLNNERILRLPEVLQRTGLSRSTIYDWIKKENFPKSISLGSKSVGWLESDINFWINSRSASRGGQIDVQ